jgi:prepilin-type N-terminal cleavage/methylation domain-containing protein
MTARRWVQQVLHRVRHRDNGSGQDGFTLIEAIVSFAIFAFVAAAASRAIFNAIDASHTTQQRVDAANVAQQFIAQAIATADYIAPESGRSYPANVGNGTTAAREDFTVIRTITFDSGNTCHPGTLYTVNVVVQQARTGKFLARSDSRIACPPA